MIIKRTTVFFAIIFGLLSLAASSGTNVVRLPNHVPLTAMSQAQHLGRLDGNTPLALAVTVPLRNQDQLAQLITRLHDPGDPLYGQFLTPAQFDQNFAPTPDDVAQVSQYMSDLGLKVTRVLGTVIDVEGSAANVERAFQLELHQYQTADARVVYAPLSDPVVDAVMAPKISGIVGLNNFSAHVAHRHRLQAVMPRAVGTGPNGGLAPSDIRKAYGLSSITVTGTGQTLGLFELDGYTKSDVDTYTQKFNINTPPTLQNILVDNFNGAAGSGADEVTLDIELMMAVAPGASKILVYEGPNTDAGVVDTYTKIAKDDLATEISTSWGAPEAGSATATLNAENAAFMQMAAQGQTIYAASGDSGAYDDGTNLGVDDPASQPYMVGVGGTTLAVNADESYQSEASWGIPKQGNNPAQGGGGGISGMWKIPTWQTGLNVTTNSGSQTMRMVPDVSLDANPNTGYAIYVGGAWNIFGGTSCAAPLWAAFTSLVNQQRKTNGTPALGFANPALYQLGASGLYGKIYHDVADNSNNLFYKAVAQYDLSTGWGSFNGGALFLSLVNPVLPPYAPGGLSLTPYHTVIDVTWAASTGSKTYTVSRGLSATGPFVPVAVDTPATSFDDSGLQDGTTYYYMVTAKNTAGPSGNSAVMSSAPVLVPPQAPSNFKAIVP